MAGLSSNVMNMKFMQKAQKSAESQNKENEVKKVKDNSEWALSDRSTIHQKIKPTILVLTVGYGSIADIMIKKNNTQENEEITKKSEETRPKPPLKVRTDMKEYTSDINIQDPKADAEKFLKDVMSLSKKRSKKLDDPKKKKKPKRH